MVLGDFLKSGIKVKSLILGVFYGAHDIKSEVLMFWGQWYFSQDVGGAFYD